MKIKVSTVGYHLVGNGKRGVIVLHSWMDDAKTWSPVFPYINVEDFSYAFMDVRGYGKSKNITGEYTTDEVVSDIFNLADRLNWEKFNLVGHSMTGMVVQKAALRDIERRILKIIAITPVAASGFPVDSDSLNFFRALIQNEELTKTGLDAFTGGKLNDRWRSCRARRHLEVTDSRAQEGYLKMWVTEDFSDEMTLVNHPFLVISGKYDHIGFRADRQQIAFEKFAEASFIDIESSGHFPMQETPILLASIMEGFLNL